MTLKNSLNLGKGPTLMPIEVSKRSKTQEKIEIPFVSQEFVMIKKKVKSSALKSKVKLKTKPMRIEKIKKNRSQDWVNDGSICWWIGYLWRRGLCGRTRSKGSRGSSRSACRPRCRRGPCATAPGGGRAPPPPWPSTGPSPCRRRTSAAPSFSPPPRDDPRRRDEEMGSSRLPSRSPPHPKI